MDIIAGSFFERSPEPYEEIGAGYRFLVMDLEVVNLSGKLLYTELGADVERQGDEYVYFELGDPEGHIYAECLIYNKGDELPISVNSGAAIKGHTTFVVPNDWSTLTLTAKHRVVPYYDKDTVIFQQELTRSGLSTPP